MNKREILETAAKLVSGDRAASHGDAYDNHAKIAAMWNGLLVAADIRLSRLLDAHDVANLMEGLKIARRYSGNFNIDDYVDGAGYAAVAGEVAVERNRVEASWAADKLESHLSTVVDMANKPV